MDKLWLTWHAAEMGSQTVELESYKKKCYYSDQDLKLGRRETETKPLRSIFSVKIYLVFQKEMNFNEF